jgi:hypothetical protein
VFATVNVYLSELLLTIDKGDAAQRLGRPAIAQAMIEMSSPCSLIQARTAATMFETMRSQGSCRDRFTFSVSFLRASDATASHRAGKATQPSSSTRQPRDSSCFLSRSSTWRVTLFRPRPTRARWMPETREAPAR